MKKIKISFILNILIFLLVLFGIITMLTNFKFMPGVDLLSVKGLECLKFFTVDSNILVGLISLILCYFEYQVIKNKRNEIPSYLYIFKLVGTVSVMLTFLVTAFYLAPSIPNGYYALYRNAYLFFHLIVPLLSLISFIFFEKTNKIKFKYLFLSLAPIILYGIFYIANILLHLDNGNISKEYDFYMFAQGGTNTIIFVFLVIQILSFIITLIIWLLNKEKKALKI